MKITEENINELFIEFCDMDANNELCLYKESFKEAITKALTLTSVGSSLPVGTKVIFCNEERTITMTEPFNNSTGYRLNGTEDNELYERQDFEYVLR